MNPLYDEVKQNPYVWDFKCTLYKSKLKKQQFWEDLAQKLNNECFPEVPFTSVEVSKKWNNLKAYYNTEHQKAIRAKKSGASSETIEDIICNWRYSQPLEFLTSTNEATSSVNNFNRSSLNHLFVENILESDTDEHSKETFDFSESTRGSKCSALFKKEEEK